MGKIFRKMAVVKERQLVVKTWQKKERNSE